jgi:hypothetical protein
VIGLTFTPPSIAGVQQAEVQDDEDEQAMVQDRKLRRLSKRREAAELRFENILNELSRVCELKENQIRKLKVASKGATNTIMSKATVRVVEGAKNEGIVLDPSAEISSENAKADRRALRKFADKNVETEKLWKASLKKALSDEQYEEWQAYLEARRVSERRFAVEKFVRKADEALFLSPKQKESLMVVVDNNYGEFLVAFSQWRKSYKAEIPEVPDPDDVNADVKEMLSESQFKIWTALYSDKLVRFKSFADEIAAEEDE